MSAQLALDELRCAWHLAQQVGASAESAVRSKTATTSTPVATPTPVSGSDVTEDDRTHKAVLALLRGNGASFDTLTHAPTRTSEESAKVRGVPLASGSKAMLLKAGKPLAHGSPYVLAVMSAVRTVDWPKIRKLVDSSKLSMASIDDVAALTGCLPGAVPPFGSLFPGVQTYVDKSLVEQGPEINFNAGLRTVSVTHLPVAQYLAIEKGALVEDFTTP